MTDTADKKNDSTNDTNSRTSSVTLRAVVDRIEDGDIAVVMIESENKQTQIDVPRHLLPADVDAGAHLRITIKADKESRATAAVRIKDLQAKLLKGNK